MAKKRMNMHISTRLFEQISLEIDQSYADEFQIQHIDINKIKSVARMLSELSTESDSEAINLVNQYIAGIKLICKG